jgi:hypothetical protein
MFTHRTPSSAGSQGELNAELPGQLRQPPIAGQQASGVPAGEDDIELVVNRVPGAASAGQRFGKQFGVRDFCIARASSRRRSAVSAESCSARTWVARESEGTAWRRHPLLHRNACRMVWTLVNDKRARRAPPPRADPDCCAAQPLTIRRMRRRITAASARTRPSQGIHACKRRSARVPRSVWLEHPSRARRRDWLQAIDAW